MKPYLSLLFFWGLCYSLFTYGQENTGPPPAAADTFFWRRYTCLEKPVKANLGKLTTADAKKITSRFIKLHLDLFPQFTDTVYGKTITDLTKSLFPADLNGDKLPDMIFCGFSGREPGMTRIWINRRDSFELVFEDYQYISSIQIRKGFLTGLMMADTGCCDAYLYFTREYRVEAAGSRMIFIKGKQTASYRNAEKPASMLPTSLTFETRYDTVLIRASGAQIDDPYNPYMDTWGNIIAGYTHKILGTVMASKTDTIGYKWYYIEIIPVTRPSKSIFYDIDTFPTFIRGWIPEEELEMKN